MAESASVPDYERDVVSTRDFDSPREVVFQAFADPAILQRWWGPKGFSNTFREFDLRPGGAWRFIMHGPDGSDYEMVKQFVEVVAQERIVFDHDQPMHRFRMEMIFADADGDGTRLTWRMSFESPEQLGPIRAFLIDANEQNFDRLQAGLAAMV